MKKKLVAKIFNFLASLLLVGQTLTPALPLVVNPSYIYAQEEQAAQTTDTSPDSSTSEESEPASPDASLGGPTSEVSSTTDSSPALAPSEEPQATDQSDQSSSDSQTSESNDNTAAQSSTPESAQTTSDEQSAFVQNPPESESSAQLAPAVWSESDGKATTINNVVLNQTYTAPQNDKVKITFTKLPDPSDKLTVGEVKLSSEQQEDLSAATDTAYEFTSPMTDGTFTYELTLPLPSNVNKDDVAVKSAESVDELDYAQTVGESKEVATETITIKGLTHFTVFVLVNDIDTDNPNNLGDSDDIANGVLTAIDDTWAEQNNANANKGGGDELHVRSKEDQNKRAFVKFDTSAIPSGSEITKATLRLFMFDAPPASRDYEARLLVEGWDEDTLTWNSQPADIGSATDTTSTGTSNNVWRQWDVTSDVQAFVNDELANYGWAIRDAEEGSDTARLAKFRSSDQGTELRRPQLVVDFAAPDDQPTDYKSPTAEEASDGNGLENNPEGAFEDGGTVASHTNNTAGESHIFYNYNPFDIPEGSTINGIEVRTDWYLDSTGGTNSLDVDLSWDGGDSWTDPKSDITETDEEHVASLGAASDTWGRTWNADDFTNENFRVRVTMNTTSSGRDFFLDWIPVRVYYSEPEDTTPPTVSSAETQDTNGNGKIDGIKLTFSENIDDSRLDSGNPDGWDVVGYEGEAIGTGEGENDNMLLLTFSEGESFDTGATPTVTYTPLGGEDPDPSSTHDAAGNELKSYEASADDKALPVLLSAFTRDTDSNGQIDALELTFSEDINDSRLEVGTADGWDVDGYDGEAIGSGEEINDNVLLLTFSESGQSDTGTTPNVFYISPRDIELSTHDMADNELASGEWSTSDGAAPVSSFSSPEEGSFWNGPIEALGSSTDKDILGETDTVDFVKLFYRIFESGNRWTEIPDSQRNNEGGDEPFNWSFDWTPDSESTFDIKAEATDKAGNTEFSPVVSDVTYDVTDPTSEITYPEDEESYTEDEWDGEIRGTAEDSPSSGINSVLVSIQRDADNKYWDGADDEDGTGWRTSEGEFLNDVSAGEDGDWNFDFAFIEPEGADEGYAVRSHAVDNAGNQEDTTEVHFFFERAPVISGETESSVSSSSVTITWDTDFETTSRVIYDTVSHDPANPTFDDPFDKYGYANTTDEFDTGEGKTISHSVDISGLTAGTTYHYRTISHGSPEAVGDEQNFSTSAVAAAATTSTTSDGGGGGGGGSAPTCGDTKPGSAPTLTGASAGTNSVTLTWSAAAGPVTYYLATYGTSAGAQQFGNPNVGGAGTTSYTISGLSGGTTYYFKVRAGNGCAPGDFSNELSATPGGGFVAGPAAGFAPGVLGVEEEATPAASPSPSSEALGAQEKTAQEAKAAWQNWWWLILLLLLGTGAFWWFFARKSEK
ncbi:hypothetical protein A2W70_00095 [Candidatus Curtissbacteria bacterium RIFCSPLOWO2_02_41_11]|uniref:Fibronectin type-III domain-containing protein n=2 Tax=Candidatus Curtissiibacteriota TaxID=1752717 RepID=A0A1F5HQC0_9BACT|nr:MAG: hypothetical protein UU56_C0020G0004 [Candidatus Curtissbacteria bacterium GW2011_GWA2_41_24]OGE06344.1 MAG: hypothetical protein A2W70_00095 [Candidatus Curtissbacteria bacterium RIFCSPLOWO2_02_41_11]